MSLTIHHAYDKIIVMLQPEKPIELLEPEDPNGVRDRDLAGMDRDTTIRAVGHNAIAPNHAQVHGLDSAYSATHRTGSN